MRNARSEISHHHEFDYLVVNNDFEQALTQLRAIVVSARLSHGRQAGLSIGVSHFELAMLVRRLGRG